jgi:hypothetical protein
MKAWASLVAACGCLALVAAGPGASAARADFGFQPGSQGFEVTATEEDGSVDNRAGSHPYALDTEINFNEQTSVEPGGPYTDGDLKDLRIEQPAGLIENPSALPTCSEVAFDTPRDSPFQQSLSGESCPDDTQIGVVALHTSLGFIFESRDEGLTEPSHPAPSQARTAILTLPNGMTINPSLGAGLGVCTPAQYAAEVVSSLPGTNCPNSSKIGDVSIQSPLFAGPLDGSVFLAQPFKNPFGTMLALYVVARSAERGVIAKVPGELTADSASGQVTATFDDLPQLPYSRFAIQFRAGQRAPLVTPAACGTYPTRTDLMPRPDPEVAHQVGSQFGIIAGIGGGPCPTDAAPFAPQGQAGMLNSQAGAYSAFYLHLTRTDSEQEITSYSAQLPPGLLGRIAGIPFCPDVDIEAARGLSGTAETERPSCPTASEIGHTVSGYGLAGSLAYAPGRLYLAGPYHGAPLSVVAIDSATVGPFDLGVVVIRSAIDIDPVDAQVSIDSAASDPIPHILDGIPLHLRDIRVYIDRPEFTVNPTSCRPSAVDSSLTGSAAPFIDPDDATAAVASPFQVLFCSSLGFAPRLSLRLRGGTRRGDYPALRAVLTPHPGDANIGRVAVTLPRTEFLAQNHIGTICTRPQLEAEACPPRSVYGHASAFTPLLGEPMEGTVYLRSSSNPLPDLVTVLHGRGVRIVLGGRIDSAHGAIRATFEGLPDAPVSKFVMNLYGGKRGLLVNERDPCSAPQFATARLVGQNNTGTALRPRIQASCHAQKKKRRPGKARPRSGGQR